MRDPGEYRWSSHQAYVGRRPRPEWLETRVVMGWFLDRATFDRFVCAPIQERPAGTSAVSHAIGLVEAIDMAIGESHRTKGRRMMALRRAVGLAIADEASSPTRDGIHRALGLTGANSIRAARHRAHALRHADPIVDHLIARVRLLFAEDLSSSRSHAA